MSKPTAAESYVRSVIKAFLLLEQFTDNKQEKGIHDLSIATGLPVSTVQRLVNTLNFKGYLIQNPQNSKYRLGYALFNLSRRLSQGLSWLDEASGYMENLVSKYQETVNLAVLEEGKVMYLNKVESPHILRPSFQVGTKYPSHCTGLGKCLLAHMNPEMLNQFLVEPFLPYTKKTITDLDSLKSELRKIREQGFSIDDEEFQEGLRCVAVPIKNYSMGGTVVAAISVTAPTGRVSLDKIDEIKRDLVSVANQISKLTL